jgi:hypothetical protein
MVKEATLLTKSLVELCSNPKEAWIWIIRLTVCVTGGGAGVDNAWKEKKI